MLLRHLLTFLKRREGHTGEVPPPVYDALSGRKTRGLKKGGAEGESNDDTRCEVVKVREGGEKKVMTDAALNRDSGHRLARGQRMSSRDRSSAGVF